ncbi:MAG: hypothetical protein AAB431_01040 [Patescibacteria group bacterium]
MPDQIAPSSKNPIALSEEMGTYFLSYETFSHVEKMLSDAGLDVNLVAVVVSEIYRLASGEYSVEEFVAKLRSATALDAPGLQKFLSVICDKILRPVVANVDGLSEKIEALGGGTTTQTVPQPSPTPAPSKKIDTFSEKDEAEISSSRSFTPTNDVQEMVSTICSDLFLSSVDPDLHTRCKQLVESRVREVRDAEQTRAGLERAISEGGLGVVGRTLADMMQAIEEVVDIARKQNAEKILVERAQAKDQKQEAIRTTEDLQKKEEQALSKRYVQMTGKMPTESVAPAAPTLARSSAAISVSQQMARQEQKIDTEKVRKVIEQSTQKAAAPRPAPVPKPRVQDVSPARRLAGPVDELQAMSLTDFRRLSSEPAQAAQRIHDMIDLLEEQGYAKRVAGIHAFRTSQLEQLYLSITQDALLSGKGVDEILDSSAAQGMKKSEYDALMKLNEVIRF